MGVHFIFQLLFIELHGLILQSHASLWWCSLFFINIKTVHPSHSEVVSRLMISSRMNIKIIEAAGAAAIDIYNAIWVHCKFANLIHVFLHIKKHIYVRLFICILIFHKLFGKVFIFLF